MVWQPPKAPRGVNDILPDAIPHWRRVEDAAREVCERYGYREIRIPLFESTELYKRGMGEVTDVVEKEMFRVSGPAKADGTAGEDFSLRPEFTAGIVRAYREHGLDKSRGFMKVYAIGPIFRYERPQKGRLRQFHQVNVEALGTLDPRVDYYTRTVFEFPCDRLGAQDALGGGGRYDRLIPDMGGPDLGACGLAFGM